MACRQIREILQADRAARSPQPAAAQGGSKEPGSSAESGDAAAMMAAPDQATRQGSMDSWRSAESVLDVDTDSSSQGDASSSMSPRGSSVSGNSSSAALAQGGAGEPKEVEVVKQESSYRPIMWCA
jgi:hypothetical protein